jgi:tape measure domain-containing protein
MAKQVSEILVKLGIQGAEGLDKLKSSFRELEKAIGPNNATIEKTRRSIVEFGEASGRTEQLIRGQLEAFKGLRGQAEIGSATYSRLVNSIAQLETELKGSTAAIDSQREAILRFSASSKQSAEAFQSQITALKELQRQTRPGSSAFAQLGKDIDNARGKLTGLASEAQEFSRALNQGFGATPEKLSGQIAVLRRGMAELRFDSEKYLKTLERIRLMTITQAGRTGRAEAIAGFQAYQNPTFTGGYASPARLPDLPNTTAALEQQLSELTAELANVERGSARYVDVANRMADIQRELRSELTGTAEAFRKLDIAQAGVERRSEKLAGIQEYYRTQGPMAPGVGGYRDPATGAMIMGGARTANRIRVEESAYPTPIGPQIFPEAGRRAQESIQRSLDDVNRIYEEARVRRVEIQSKYDQIHIDKLLEGLDLEGRVRDKGFRDELAAFDRQLEARDRKRRRGLTAGQAVQAAGAVISGGIFGGVEGLVGGVGGAILGSAVPGLGTVGGAFAGAAAGAQIGMLRQQAGAVAQYTAELNLAKTTLAQAASSQQEYNQLLQLARSVSSDYAVALKPSIEGLAQIAVAARANNLTFAETEAIYRGVIASGVAFGKSQQDLDALIRATTQVLSKGKVSAEEMSGQIGERLPGAVAKFAAATGRTLPELSKAFENGEVTIADFVKFARGQFEEYDDIAQLIAEGPEKAGIRLQIALDNASENFGGFFQRTGSGLQDFLANMINWVNENSRQIKQFVTDWVNAGAAIAGVLSKLVGAFGRTLQRIYQFMQANPGVALANTLGGQVARMFGITGQAGGGKYKVEDLFPEFKPSQFGGGGAAGIDGGDAGAKDSEKAAREAEKLARERQRQYEETFRDLARIQDMSLKTLLVEELTTLERQRREMIASGAGRVELEALRLKERQLQVDVKQTAINEENSALDDLRAQGLQQGLDVERIAEKIAQNRLEYKQLQLEAEQNMTAELELQRKILESMGLTQEMQSMGRRAGIAAFDFGAAGGGFGADAGYESGEFATPAMETFAEMKADLQELVSIENQVANGARVISESFANAFTETISGATSARQALADMMRSIGESFLQMAQQIIAKQLAMIIFGSIMKALGISTSPFSGGSAPNYSGILGGGQAGFNPAAFSMPALNAKGNVYAKNGIQPFAMGGIVNRPTLFKYAKGGEMQNGLMGEAGPEAIMPLKRGPDGKLGVVLNNQSSAGNERMREVMERGIAASPNPSMLNMTFQTTNIGGVEYVSRDQLEAAMVATRKAAANDGAKRGTAATLSKLQNSPSTRAKLGLR